MQPCLTHNYLWTRCRTSRYFQCLFSHSSWNEGSFKNVDEFVRDPEKFQYFPPECLTVDVDKGFIEIVEVDYQGCPVFKAILRQSSM